MAQNGYDGLEHGVLNCKRAPIGHERKQAKVRIVVCTLQPERERTNNVQVFNACSSLIRLELAGCRKHVRMG